MEEVRAGEGGAGGDGGRGRHIAGTQTLPLLPASTPPICYPFRARAPPPVRGSALYIPVGYHAGLWAVFCETPVLHEGCGVPVKCFMFSHVRALTGCCAVVFHFAVACDECGTAAGYCSCA